MTPSVRRSLVTALALAAALSGCQREPEFVFAPVTGTVTKNGAPLPGVRVIFYPDADADTRGPRSLAVTDAAGHYQLRTDTGVDGAAVGNHRVCLLEPHDLTRVVQQRFAKQPGAAKDLADKLTPADAPRLPPAYGSVGQTPLRAEVRAGSQSIDFTVP